MDYTTDSMVMAGIIGTLGTTGLIFAARLGIAEDIVFAGAIVLTAVILGVLGIMPARDVRFFLTGPMSYVFGRSNGDKPVIRPRG